MGQTPKTKNEEIQLDKIKANCIMHAIEIESNFKLYSYRIITHEVFIERTKELVKTLENSWKK